MGKAESNRKDHTEISGSIILFWIQYRKIGGGGEPPKKTSSNKKLLKAIMKQTIHIYFYKMI